MILRAKTRSLERIRIVPNSNSDDRIVDFGHFGLFLNNYSVDLPRYFFVLIAFYALHNTYFYIL